MYWTSFLSIANCVGTGMLLMPSEVQTQAQNNFFSLAKKKKEGSDPAKKERTRQGGREGAGGKQQTKKKRKRKGKRIQDHLLLCLSCTGPNSLLSLPGAPVRWRGPRRRLVCLSVGGCASKSDLSLSLSLSLSDMVAIAQNSSAPFPLSFTPATYSASA